MNRVFPRLRDNARVLRSAYAMLADDVHREQLVTSAAEWLLDHFHLVTAEIRAIRQNLPHAYYRELPRLPQRQWAGHTRIYAMALELIRHSDSRLDRSQLVRFMNSYQSVAPLTIGELWAWPSILKLALIENLRRLAEEMIAARSGPGRGRCHRERMGGRAPASVARRAGRSGLRGPPAPARARIRPAPAVPACRDRSSSGRARPDGGRRDPRRTSASGRRAGVGRQRPHQPAAVLDARLERLLRGRQPRRAGAAARSRRRLRLDGLPEPRPPAAGGRGTRGADRRGAGRHRAASD